MDPEGRVIGAWVFEVGDGYIQRIFSIVNPEKLAHLGEVGDLVALLRRGRATPDQPPA